MDPLFLVLFVVIASLAAFLLVRRGLEARSQERLWDDEAEETRTRVAQRLATHGLRGFLVRAGFRRARNLEIFLLTQLLCLVLGALVQALYANSQLAREGGTWLVEIPGGVGAFLAPVIGSGGLILFVLFAMIPVLHVRAMRRRRVREIERDLPIVLELLASLGEAGLGFETALQRMLRAQPRDRVLAEELRLHQLEMQAGLGRTRSLRRLAERIALPPVNLLVSALVQAEQVGSGVAQTLRQQADEQRARRRAQALMMAQSLPVKLTIPLVICFLPGIFVVTMGPAFQQFFQLADQVIRDLP